MTTNMTPGLRTYEDAQAAFFDALRTFRLASIREIAARLHQFGAEELLLQWNTEAPHITIVAIISGGRAVEGYEPTYAQLARIIEAMDFHTLTDARLYLTQHRSLSYLTINAGLITVMGPTQKDPS